MMNDQQLTRYSRQILLPQIDYEGQERLLESHALIVGLGGLGSPASLYLAAAGVGHLTLVDFDTVDLSNLQRQIVHRTTDVGRPKIESARDNLAALNPDVRIDALPGPLDEDALRIAVRAADVVLDCTDNFTARHAINRACVAERKPLVSAAAIRLEGQLSVFDTRKDESPCYHCLYREDGEELETCTRNGILAPVVGSLGTLQALEAIKVLLGLGEPLVGRLLLFDALTFDLRTLRLKRDPSCPVCAQRQTGKTQDM
ncbi:MAG: molybdopterin-synthase adenylyltransferase MoeB [Pseudomonadota bacterium]